MADGLVTNISIKADKDGMLRFVAYMVAWPHYDGNEIYGFYSSAEKAEEKRIQAQHDQGLNIPAYEVMEILLDFDGLDWEHPYG